jgi:sugar transferase (PEP-CTERM/EpsH1 system associated)
MMHILYIVPYAPNLIRVRPENLIRELTKRGHAVTVATLWSDESEKNDIARLSQTVYRVEDERLSRQQSYWNCLTALPSDRPLQSVYSRSPQLESKLASMLSSNGRSVRPFDVIHVEHLRGIPYALKAKQVNPGIPVVWDAVDNISLLFRKAAVQSKRRLNRWITAFELAKTERYEKWLTGQFNHITVTSPHDRQAFLDLAPEGSAASRISVLPNGVDLDYFCASNTVPRNEDTIVITGKMSYHANITMVTYFVETVFPLIQKSRPDVKLWIVGKDPTAEILAYGNSPEIMVTGYVEDIRPYLRSATVAVAPVRYGVGIQNKVLEAMACATPVVSTSQAISALQVIPGQDLLIADEPGDFADQVVRLLADRSLRKEIGEAGLSYVQKNHKWSLVTDRLEGIYNEVVNEKGA